MYWSPALPMGTVLEGGEGRKLNAGDRWTVKPKCLGEERVQTFLCSQVVSYIGAFEQLF